MLTLVGAEGKVGSGACGGGGVVGGGGGGGVAGGGGGGVTGVGGGGVDGGGGGVGGRRAAVTPTLSAGTSLSVFGSTVH